ncbi:glycosyltransferase [Amphibacillus jilinensis]|uniref:glycosyltransferase n=1 Tax=Amphibacillus jilinensis TaxID=1216008 RepID=UPI00030BCB45|nr:glycosyltransferase [Amphibacillus jilinensis]
MRLTVISHACVTDVNQQVYSEMEKLGYHVDVIVPSNFIAADLTNKPIKVKRWPGFNGEIIEIPTILNRSIPLHFYRKNLKHVLKRLNPDAIYLAEEPYSLSCFQSIRYAKALKIPVGFYSAQNIYKNYPFIIKQIEQYTYNYADLAVSISKDVTGVLRDKGYQKSLIEIPLGVDEAHFNIDYQIRQYGRAELDLSNDTFVIGFAGRLVEEKGVDILFKAFKKSLAFLSDIHLIIVGRGPLQKELRALATNLHIDQQVSFIDNAEHSEMSKWFNCMDVHVLPSKTSHNWKEQFGRVLIEAAACGVASIGSNCGEIPQVLKALRMDWVFEEDDIAQLSNRIIVAAKAEKNRLSIRERAINKFGNKQIAQMIIASFEKIVG